MHQKVAVVYNEPIPCRYGAMGEEKAELGVLDAVEAITTALIELGYSAIRVPFQPPLESVRAKLQTLEADLIFNLFEGFDGSPQTEAIFADFLHELGKPYTGCLSTALALALDKSKTKELLKGAGIDTPDHQLLSPSNLAIFRLNYPCIVKPCGEDASHGLLEESVVKDFASLEKQVERVSRLFGGVALVEEFIDGREFNATVLGDGEFTVLPISEIVYSLPPNLPRLLTFAAKWEPDNIYFNNTPAKCPADIGEKLQARIVKIARAAFKLVVGQGYARVDMRMSGRSKLYVLEVNPNPDISPGTGAARQAEATGMTYSQFTGILMRLALRQCNPVYVP